MRRQNQLSRGVPLKQCRKLALAMHVSRVTSHQRAKVTDHMRTGTPGLIWGKTRTRVMPTVTHNKKPLQNQKQGMRCAAKTGLTFHIQYRASLEVHVMTVPAQCKLPSCQVTPL